MRIYVNLIPRDLPENMRPADTGDCPIKDALVMVLESHGIELTRVTKETIIIDGHTDHHRIAFAGFDVAESGVYETLLRTIQTAYIRRIIGATTGKVITEDNVSEFVCVSLGRLDNWEHRWSNHSSQPENNVVRHVFKAPGL